MLQPQNPWETGELAGLLSVPKDEGEVVNTWTVGVGFDYELAKVLRGRVEPHRYRRTIHQLNHITRKENVYNYTFTLLMLIFVILPIGYFFFFADITRSTQGKEVIILHDKLLMAIAYAIIVCDLPALIYVAYLGYRKEQNDIHSLTHLLLIIVAVGNTIAYPFALEFIHAEKLSELFLLYPILFPFLALISIFINRRLPELLGEANEFLEKENQEYYLSKGLTLRLRPELGDRLRLCVNLSSSAENFNSETAANHPFGQPNERQLPSYHSTDQTNHQQPQQQRHHDEEDNDYQQPRKSLRKESRKRGGNDYYNDQV